MTTHSTLENIMTTVRYMGSNLSLRRLFTLTYIGNVFILERSLIR